MCGIVARLGPDGKVVDSSKDVELRSRLLRAQRQIRHRGPDWSGLHKIPGKNWYLAHERLCIVDPGSGHQPLHGSDESVAVSVNGEIYNHQQLTETHLKGHTIRTKSDCECIGHLYEVMGTELVHELDGMWSFVLTDSKTGRFIAARDPIGVTPLYIGYGRDGSIWFASEIKAIFEECARIELFPPGHIYDSSKGKGTKDRLTQWYNPIWHDGRRFTGAALDYGVLKKAFIDAVKKRMMTDVPFGVLLSGGLDSSLVTAIAARHGSEVVNCNAEGGATKKLSSFAVGLVGSPDLAAAAKAAKYIGTDHHEITFTVQEGLDAIRDVIWHLETFDRTTVRASTPMYLLSRAIKSRGVKMVLSGEGADEIFGGYLYFHKCPSPEEMAKETSDKLKGLHQYDCLRANKSTHAFGVEARVPFLDKAFLDVAMTIDAEHKMCDMKSKPDGKHKRMEKYILRKAFDDEENPYLPEEILWRQKEQFSDGVGYSWIDQIQEYCNESISDAQMDNAENRFPVNSPKTKEDYFYRTVFDQHYGSNSSCVDTVPGGASIACSTPAAIAWDASFAKMADPSGRAIGGVHEDAY